MLHSKIGPLHGKKQENTTMRHLTLATIKHFDRSAACLLLVLLSTYSAQASLINVSNVENVLPGSGRTVTASDGGIGGLNSTAAVIDNLAAANNQDDSFIFASTANEALSITGFNATGG